MKYGSLTLGNIEALCNMCGGEETVDAILRGEKKITIEDIIRLLVDKSGRCIKQPQGTAKVCDANMSLRFDPLPDGFEFQPIGMEVEEFKGRIEAIKAKVAANIQVANLLKGVSYPILLPQISAGDYGALMEEIFLPLVEASYTKAFPERKFYNYHKGKLTSKVSIVDERHQRLVADLSDEPIPGILFFPLQGFSVQAQREMANLMPENISLAGAIEIAVAEATYPRILSRGTTPLKDCSAVLWLDADCSLCFDARGGQLGFNGRYDLAHAGGNSCGALFCRG